MNSLPRVKRTFSEDDIVFWEAATAIRNIERKKTLLERQMHILDVLSRGYFYYHPTSNSKSHSKESDNIASIQIKGKIENFTKGSQLYRRGTSISDYIRNDHIRPIILEKYSAFDLSASDYASDRPLTSCVINDSNILFLGSMGGEIIQWDMTTYEKCCSSIIGETKVVSLINFKKNGIFAACFDGSVYKQANSVGWSLWSVLDPRLNGLFYSDHTSLLASADSSGSFRLMDPESATTLQKTRAHNSGCYSIDFHPGGALLGTNGLDGDVKIWDLQCGQSILTIANHKCVSLSFRKSEHEILLGSDDGVLRNYDMRNLNYTNEKPIHNSNIMKIVDTGDALVLSSYDGKLSILNHNDLSAIKYLEGHQGRVSSCCYSTQIESIISCGFDKSWKVWSKI